MAASQGENNSLNFKREGEGCRNINREHEVGWGQNQYNKLPSAPKCLLQMLPTKPVMKQYSWAAQRKQLCPSSCPSTQFNGRASSAEFAQMFGQNCFAHSCAGCSDSHSIFPGSSSLQVSLVSVRIQTFGGLSRSLQHPPNT